MKAIVPKANLLSIIGKIQNVVPSKPTIPILANILIEAMNDELIISATDLTVSMRAQLEAKVLEEGSITVPARRFFQLIRELTAPQLEIHATPEQIAYINAGSSHFKLHGMHKNEFPTLPDLSAGAQMTIQSTVLKEMLSKTVFAAAKDDSRQELNGVLMQNSLKAVTFVGTDGKRLAKNTMNVDLTQEVLGSFILPIKAAEEIVKLLDTQEENIKLLLFPDKIAVETNSIVLISKQIAGQYPDFSRVIPEKKENSILLHRDELISLLRQVCLFTPDNSSSVRFTFKQGELHLSATNGEIGEGKVQMPVNYGGEKQEIAFNPHYFLEILRHSSDEAIKFDMTDSYNPGLITDSSNAQFVLMPMRLDV